MRRNPYKLSCLIKLAHLLWQKWAGRTSSQKRFKSRTMKANPFSHHVTMASSSGTWLWPSTRS